MKEDKIKDLFRGYNPELSSDSIFMSRLQRNMKGVELLKQQTAAARCRNKTAVLVASILGFIVGILLTLLIPHLFTWITTIKISLPYISISPIEIDMQILSCPLAAIAATLISYNTYKTTLYRLSFKK